MRKNLPSLAALEAFETVARHLSFKKAANEMHLSASAVSHQIRALENFLGTSLFIRENGKIELTGEGMTYFDSVNKILNELEVSTLSIKSEEKEADKIILNLDHSLIHCWLGGIIGQFNVIYPDIQIEFISSEYPPDYSIHFDLALYYAREPHKGMDSYLLSEDRIALVSGKELSKELPKENEIQKIGDKKILHCSSDPMEWDVWLDSYGLGHLKNIIKITSNYRAMILNWAVSNMGVAIGRSLYLESYLKEGSLVIPYSKKIQTGYRHYLAIANGSQKKISVMKFKDWLLDEANHLHF